MCQSIAWLWTVEVCLTLCSVHQMLSGVIVCPKGVMCLNCWFLRVAVTSIVVLLH